MTTHLRDWEDWIRPMPLAERLARKTKPGPIPQSQPALGPCLLWTGHVGNVGYGVLNIRGPKKRRKVLAHRLAYELARGEIPNGLDIDHLCSVKICVNPDHMEPVTRRENFLRANQNAGKTHCPQGHPYSPENTYLKKARYGSRRVCRTCQQAHSRLEEARQKAERRAKRKINLES